MCVCVCACVCVCVHVCGWVCTYNKNIYTLLCSSIHVQQCCLFPSESYSIPVPHDHPQPVTASSPPQSPKRLVFNDKSSATESLLQPIIPLITVKTPTSIIRLDDDDVSLQLYICHT